MGDSVLNRRCELSKGPLVYDLVKTEQPFQEEDIASALHKRLGTRITSEDINSFACQKHGDK